MWYKIFFCSDYNKVFEGERQDEIHLNLLDLFMSKFVKKFFKYLTISAYLSIKKVMESSIIQAVENVISIPNNQLSILELCQSKYKHILFSLYLTFPCFRG